MSIIQTTIIFGAKYLYLVAVAIFVIYFLLETSEKKREIVWLSVIALPIIFIISRIAGALYFDPRPFVTDGFAPLIPHIVDNGFPSDHTLLVSALASIAYFFSKKIGVVLFVFALVVGISRVLAGVHHTIDIIGSILIATIITALVYYFILPKIVKPKSSESPYL